MRTSDYLLLVLLTVFLATTFSGCKKTQDELIPDPAPALSYLNAMEATNDVFLTFRYYNPQDLTQPGQFENITITVTPLYPVDSFPKIITIEFDSSGVLCPDSIVRKGKMICRLDSPWDQHPSKTDITFEDFYIGNNRIDGLFSFKSAIQNDSLTLEYNVLQGTIICDNSDSVTFDMEFEINTAFDRSDRSLDPFSWYSSDIQRFSGYDFNKKPFKAFITKQIFFDNICNKGEITTGEIRIEPDASTDFSANFGTGECDRSLTLIISGTSIPVSF